MLPAGSRLHTAEEFAAVVRRGRRSASPRLVVHLLTETSAEGSDRSARAGFVVSGKVGNAVVRHRVTRRLRALVRPLLVDLPAGTDLVVRALPAAASAGSAELGTDLRTALAGALRKARHGRGQAGPVGAVR
jgi:ribonuclease P protein component